MKTNFILPFSQLSNKDVAVVGGKNASLGEMIRSLTANGILIPDGFATTNEAYLYFLFENMLEKKIRNQLEQLDTKSFSNLNETSKNIRNLLLCATMPDTLRDEIRTHYAALCEKYGNRVSVAVRSSATAEDLPTASFAGLHDSFLNIQGDGQLSEAVKKCFASLFNARAIKYRSDYGFDHMKVALSAGIQLMVRSDMASSGICFTLEPESGFRDVVTISGCWGLGENIVQGNLNPDEFCVFKPMLRAGKKAILYKKLGTKAKTMVYAPTTISTINTTINTDTLPEKQKQWVLNDCEITQLAQWCMEIEEHYHCPMDIEWAKDGNDNRIYIIQARPETVHSIKDPYVKTEYQLKETGNILATGNAVGSGVACGKARIILSPAEAEKLQPGEVLVTDITNPDWDPILKKASAIITNKGGRTSHAAIIAREIGAVAIVGAGNATETIKDGEPITVSCAQGKTGLVYHGLLKWETRNINFHNIPMPDTAPMLILGDPDKAFLYSFYPNRGIGLMRLEFIITNAIRIHPMALIKYNQLTDAKAKIEIAELTHEYPVKEVYFIDKLTQAVATIGAAFYPKDVIVRMSDFKTNEYASLIGGKEFEPTEENPMLGFRGASRYYNERYREGFRLECEAMKKVRNDMGLTNIKLMIPFCRTVEEGKKVISLMEKYGLHRGEEGLEIYMMAEIPSNIILAKEFAHIFDGFSIGSNDLTQLTLGVDRDSAILSNLFDENNPAVKNLIASLIHNSKQTHTKIGLCGQAPSDFPEFTRFLIEQGIDSISFNPDSLLKGITNMLKAETTKAIAVHEE